MRKWIFLSLAAASFNSYAGRIQVCDGFFPKNTLSFPVTDDIQAMATTQTQFNEALNRLQREFAADVARAGGQLVIERKWSDGTVNAYAYQQAGKWIIAMFGGLARHPKITADGFTAVACHELGHHIGGAPRDAWASVEGEADYYSTLKCLRRLWRSDDNAKIIAGRTLDPNAVKQCEAEHRGRQDQLLCIRGAMAGLNLAAVLASLNGVAAPKTTTPDPRRVWRISEDHPAPQCRLDTYFQGALCRVPYSQARSNTSYRTGACADERTYARGLRPRCWFNPN